MTTLAQPVAATLSPRTAVEERLGALWAEALEADAVGIADDFFEAGGGYRQAARLVERIRDELGVKLPLSDVLQGATVAKLAALVDPERAASSAVVPLQPYGGRPPFFVGGSHQSYTRLPRLLGPDQPLFQLDILRLQERRLTGGAPYTTIEAIAAHCVEEIKRVQPSGPYSLGGGCEAGIVALEIAQQLRRRGDRVALLLVWDTWLPGQKRERPLAPLLHLVARVEYLTAYAARHGAERTVAMLRERLGHAPPLAEACAARGGARGEADRYRDIRDAVARLEAATPTRPPSTGAARDPVARFLHIREALFSDILFAPVRAYVPEPYDGRVVFVRARTQPRWLRPSTSGWHRLARGGLEVAPCRGNHLTILSEHLGEFAGIVARHLARST